ncbi:MAG: DUF2840 domain-containing protein [Desulfuromonadales bacterium]|nr:DUF2840 domain-containing protein [Desulfuromonadales bacterium]
MEYLTKIHLHFDEKKRNSKLLFGTPAVTENISFTERSSRKNVFFKPDNLLALELWVANDHGTLLWMIYIVRTVWPGEKAHKVPFVEPGAEILLHARGKGRTSRALQWLRRLQKIEADLSRLSPDYYRIAHYYLKNNIEPRKPNEPHGPVLDFLKHQINATT